MNRTIVRAGAALAVAMALAACSASGGGGPSLTGNENPDATVFLAQNIRPDAVMEALYVGRVVRDEQGCLRTESEGGALVIWPYGSSLQARDGGLYVRIEEGRSIGRIGGSFRMGGGYVPAAAFEHLSPSDRALAESRCPSTHYWVVGDPEA